MWRRRAGGCVSYPRARTHNAARGFGDRAAHRLAHAPAITGAPNRSLQRRPYTAGFVSAAATQPPRRARDRRGAVRRVVAPVRALHPALVVLLVLAAAHGVAWAVVTAPLNGPDESAHFAYAQDLAENHHAPSRDGGGRLGVHRGGDRAPPAQPAADPAAPRGQADLQLDRPHEARSSPRRPPPRARTAPAPTPPPTTRRSTTPTRPSPTRSPRLAVAAGPDVLHAPGDDAAAGRHGVADVADRRGAVRPHVGARAGDRDGRAAAQARLRRRDHQPRPHARDGGHGRAAHGSAARAPRPDARARAVAGGLRRRRRAHPSTRALPAARSR